MRKIYSRQLSATLPPPQHILAPAGWQSAKSSKEAQSAAGGEKRRAAPAEEVCKQKPSTDEMSPDKGKSQKDYYARQDTCQASAS